MAADISGLQGAIEGLSQTNNLGFQALAKIGSSNNKLLQSLDGRMKDMEKAAYETAREGLKDIKVPGAGDIGKPGGAAGKPGDAVPGQEAKSKFGFLKGLGSLFTGPGIGAGVALAGLGILFAGGGYLIKQLNELDGKKIAREIEALTSMKVTPVDGAKLALSLGAIGMGLAILGFGQIVVGVAEGVDMAVTGTAFQDFIGNDQQGSVIDRVIQNVEKLLQLGSGIRVSELLSAGGLAIAMAAIGGGLIAFGAGQAVVSLAGVVTTLSDGVRQWLTGELSTETWAERVVKNVNTLLSIGQGVTIGAMLAKGGTFAATMALIAGGLIAFGIGQAVSGGAEMVTTLSDGLKNWISADGPLSGTTWAERIKTNVEHLLSIGTTEDVLAKAGNAALALGTIGLGLILFGAGKTVASVGELANTAAKAADKAVTDWAGGTVYPKGFGEKIYNEVKNLIKISEIKLGDTGKFVATMGAIGAGLVAFAIGKTVAAGAEAVTGLAEGLTTWISGDLNETGWAARIATEVNALLSIGGDKSPGTLIAEGGGFAATMALIAAGLVVFSTGSAIANVVSAVGDGVGAAINFFTGGEGSPGIGFGEKIAKEVNALLSVGSGKDLSLLQEGGEFAGAMAGIAAGILIFSTANLGGTIFGAAADLIGSKDGVGPMQRLANDINSLLNLKIDVKSTNDIKLGLTNLGEALSAFSSEQLGAAFDQFLGNILSVFGSDKSPIGEIIELTDKTDELDRAADAIVKITTALGKLSGEVIDLGDLNIDDFANDYLKGAQKLEAGVFGGAHAQRVLNPDDYKDKDDRGILQLHGLANMSEGWQAAGRNLSAVVGGAMGKSDAGTAEQALMVDTATFNNVIIKQMSTGAVDRAQGAAAETASGINGGDVNIINAQDQSTPIVSGEGRATAGISDGTIVRGYDPILSGDDAYSFRSGMGR